MECTNIGCGRRVGFFPLTADPIHYGHLRGALAVQERLELESVYIQVAGDLPDHKPDKAPKIHRHRMAQLAIAEFSPILCYTPLGYDTNRVGEELFLDFIHSPEFRDVSMFYYIAGVDNLEIVRSRFHVNASQTDRRYQLVFLVRDGCALPAEEHFLVTSDEDCASFLYRSHQRADFVPETVQRYCREHHLYGY